ncbi:MAG: hypothetical protein GZ089_04580 [Aromatoleum sp.]|nr:hypothetical protein [Aromatoleum sp.]
MTELIWFSRAGLPFSPDEEAHACALAERAAGFTRVTVERVADWRAIAGILRATDREDPWWEMEEAERQRLWQCAADRHAETVLLARIAAINGELAASVRAAAEASAAREDVADSGVTRAAAGAVLVAEQQSALVELAGEANDHYFVRKRAAFTGGRWPLGYHRGAYFVF